MDITIRVAEEADAEPVATVLRRSITELCYLDHLGDEFVLKQWLANKTEPTVAQWLLSPQAIALVAVKDDNLVGIGMLSRSGELLLCYVVPEVLGVGVGHRLLCDLLQVAEEWKLERVFLESTATAQSFYLRNGFKPVRHPVAEGDILGYPMLRELTADNT